MFDEPVKSNISNLQTKLNLIDGDLIPGELLIPYSPLAVIAAHQAEIINNDRHILYTTITLSSLYKYLKT